MPINWTTPPAATAMHAVLAHRDGLRLFDPHCEARATRSSDALADRSRDEIVSAFMAAIEGEEPPFDVTPVIADWSNAKSDEGLTHRVRPLREQWEARGPGMLRVLEKRTQPLGCDQATVLLASPMVGGHGVALPSHNAVLFEAVLANPLPELPEVVRLAWLLAQLGSDADPGDLVAEVLAAAEEVELAVCDPGSIAAAMEAWRVSRRGSGDA